MMSKMLKNYVVNSQTAETDIKNEKRCVCSSVNNIMTTEYDYVKMAEMICLNY